MPERATPWDLADKAYQAHHFSCRQCIGAGATPGTQARCSVGQALWDTYNQAGAPPHFTWLAKKGNPLTSPPSCKKPLNHAPSKRGFFTPK